MIQYAQQNAVSNQPITLGLSIEKLTNVNNLNIVRRGVEDRGGSIEMARKIALNLYNYLQSFVSGPTAGYMQVPTNVFERWINRFEEKYKRDPYFFMKSTD